jgi:DNA helicase-2/ATP-dependent DNA helicase PcrA
VPDPTLLEELLATFTLSATSLNAYLTCPLACYYEQILKVPAPRREKMLFGTAAHRALETFFRQAQQPGASGFGTADELAELFQRYFARSRFELPAAMFQRLATAGPQLLRAWWAQAALTAQPTAVVEYAVQATLPGGTRLTGKLDRLDLLPDGRRAEVLDYKTGNFESARSRLAPAPPAAAEATLAEWLADPRLRGGDYWRQGVLYRLLLAHDPERRYEATSLRFEFLQPVRKPGKAPHYERHRLVPTPAEEATVLSQATAVDAAIRRHEFGPGCGQCLWCQLQAARPTN